MLGWASFEFAAESIPDLMIALFVGRDQTGLRRAGRLPAQV